MQTNLLPKLKQHIDDVYSTLVFIEEDKLSQMIKKIHDDIKAFMKDEQSAVSKDLAKKTKELFVLSSDKESLTEKVADLEGKLKRLTQKLAEKQKYIAKLMNDKERELRQQQEKLNQTINSLKKQLQNMEIKIFETETKYKSEISDLRKIHKEQIVKAIVRQQQIAEASLEKQRQQFNDQKKSMIQAQNKEKSELIKKYEHKLQDLRDINEQEVFKLTSEHKEINEKDKKIKADLNQDLFNAESLIKRLQGDLSRQTLSHSKFKTFSETLTSQLESFNADYVKTKQALEEKLASVISEQTKNERRLNGQIQGLKELLQNTIKQKDTLFNETVNMMKTDHTDELESTKSMLIEEKEIAINESEMKHYSEAEKLNNKFYALQKQYQKLHEAHKTIADEYEQKIAQMIAQYESTLSNIEKRNNYEVTLEGQASKKTLEVIQRKYKLEIKSLKKDYDDMKEELTKRINDQKLAITNKLTTQYQTIINDIKVNNDVSMKQKLIEFDRKSKAYEKKLAEAQKRRLDLKIQMDRQKLQMQMKIESLSQLVEKLELEIEELHHHIVKMEKQKTTVINEYEFKLLVKRNEFQQLKDDFQIKEHELRNVFNEHIRVKNSEIQKFTQKVTVQVEKLITKHNKRVQTIQKEYAQLKKIMSQRTSLPEDIEALKIFNKAFVKLEEEIEKERQMKRNVQRQLQSKAAIEKVFVSKSFVPKVQQTNPIKVVTMKEFFKKDQKLVKFKSQNL